MAFGDIPRDDFATRFMRDAEHNRMINRPRISRGALPRIGQGLAQSAIPLGMPGSRRGVPLGTDGKPMDVVYDQGPEFAAKKLKQGDRELDIKQEQVRALTGLKLDELGVKQQNADTLRMRAESIVNDNNMTESEKIEALARNAMGLEGVRQVGRKEVTGMQTASREKVAEGQNKSREQIAAENRAARMEIEKVEQEGAMKRIGRTGEIQNARDQFRANNQPPREQAIAVRERMRQVLNENPQYQDLVEFDDDGNFRIKQGTPSSPGGLFSKPDLGTEALRGELTRKVYGPQDVPLYHNRNSGLVNPQAPPTQPPAQTPVMRQRNPRTGQVRESMDGGATWRIVQ